MTTLFIVLIFITFIASIVNGVKQEMIDAMVRALEKLNKERSSDVALQQKITAIIAALQGQETKLKKFAEMSKGINLLSKYPEIEFEQYQELEVYVRGYEDYCAINCESVAKDKAKELMKDWITEFDETPGLSIAKKCGSAYAAARSATIGSFEGMEKATSDQSPALQKRFLTATCDGSKAGLAEAVTEAREQMKPEEFRQLLNAVLIGSEVAAEELQREKDQRDEAMRKEREREKRQRDEASRREALQREKSQNANTTSSASQSAPSMIVAIVVFIGFLMN